MNKILVLVGSNSENSINRAVALKISAKERADLLELKDYTVPFYSGTEHQKGYPAKMTELANKISSYEKVVLVTPEHNGLLPSFSKNIFDWLSVNPTGGQYFKNIKVLIVATSPGDTGGETVRSVTTKVLPYTGAIVLGSYGVKSYTEAKDLTADIEAIHHLLNK
ncbi:NADPH-dependent FMN reductase [[Mycoplasma] testudinis]|uniref:NADPH-dependent FMN reductase n=1 Tax=[Mycoplasma] testudinis TaxID=33924 RepID=UPI000488ABFF|nr:NAD(P)H-dependent oxidoreductase [[Mycoplasma] testudinis]